MNLKGALEADLSNVFFNSNEFATDVTIDDAPVTVVVDNDVLMATKLKNGGEGLITDKLLFHVKKVEMPFDPFPGQPLKFNHSNYVIADVSESFGMYSITLEVSDS